MITLKKGREILEKEANIVVDQVRAILRESNKEELLACILKYQERFWYEIRKRLTTEESDKLFDLAFIIESGLNSPEES